MNDDEMPCISADLHWDFDLPSMIDDLPFRSKKTWHNVLGGTATRLFEPPPGNAKHKEKNWIK
jgi:uncharacterized protein